MKPLLSMKSSEPINNYGLSYSFDESDRVLRRQSMRRRESGEHCIRLYQGRRGDDQGFPLRKSALHFRNGSLMVLMPGTHRGDHDAGVRKKTAHRELGRGGCPVAGELPSCPLDLLARELLDRLFRHRDKEPATFLQRDEKRCRFDFNQSLPPADFQLAARLQTCFPSQFLGNHQTTDSIDGCFHGMKCTITFPIL